MSGIRLTRRLVLEQPTRQPDGLGGYSENWEALGELWGEVDPGRGRLRGRSEVAVSEVPTTIFVRGAPVGSPRRPRPEQRFREGTRVWRVLAVSEADTAARYLRCDTVEEATA